MTHLDLEKLTEAQREAVVAGPGPALVVAGAGTGKTRTLVHRAAWLIAEERLDPETVFAVTFTNRAAAEMKARLGALLPGLDPGPFVGTFHRLGLFIISIEHDALGLPEEFPILDRAESVHILSRRALPRWEELEMKASEVMEGVSRLKGRMLAPEDCLRPGAPDDEALLGAILQAYDEELRRLGALDYDDLILLPLRLLAENQRVRDRWRDRVRHLLIDEYQDVNPAQAALARMLAAPENNIFAIGDADQAIYSFRGANILNFLQFGNQYPGAATIRLEDSFRCAEPIAASAQALVNHNERRIPKRLISRKPGGAGVRSVLVEDDRAEVRYILETIEGFLGGSSSFEHDSETADSHLEAPAFSFSDFAVLTRINALIPPIAKAFDRWGIPYQWVGGARLTDRPEARALLAHIKAAINPGDERALIEAMTTPPKGIGESAIDALIGFQARDGLPLPLAQAVAAADRIPGLNPAQRKALAAFADRLRDMAAEIAPLTAREAIRLLLETAGLEPFFADMQNRDPNETWFALESMAVKHDKLEPVDSKRAFIEDATLMAEADAFNPRIDAVALMTLHAAKGLEFPAVFIVGLEPGLIPFWRGAEEPDQEAVEEERRLLHVGMTRAMDRLFLLRTRKRFLFGETRINARSPFLDELPGEFVVEETVAPRERPHRPKPPPDNQLSLF